MSDQTNNSREEAKEYFDQYWQHASVLRNWFVAYGIGALVLVVHDNGSFFITSSHRHLFVLCIAYGIALQIVLTFVNKLVHWFAYYGSHHEHFTRTKRYKCSYQISEWFYFDIAFDIFTILFYTGAFWAFFSNL